MVRSVTLQKLKWSPLTSVVLPPVALKAIPKALLLNTLLPCVPVQVHWTDGFSFKNVCVFKMSSCFTILLWQVFLWQLQKNEPKNPPNIPYREPLFTGFLQTLQSALCDHRVHCSKPELLEWAVSRSDACLCSCFNPKISSSGQIPVAVMVP